MIFNKGGNLVPWLFELTNQIAHYLKLRNAIVGNEVMASFSLESVDELLTCSEGESGVLEQC